MPPINRAIGCVNEFVSFIISLKCEVWDFLCDIDTWGNCPVEITAFSLLSKCFPNNFIAKLDVRILSPVCECVSCPASID